jgi:phosphosulfolactate phosphohydrolase-like enzyme
VNGNVLTVVDGNNATQTINVSAATEIRSTSGALNARRLLANPDLKDDVAYCLQLDSLDIVASLRTDGWIRVA